MESYELEKGKTVKGNCSTTASSNFGKFTAKNESFAFQISKFFATSGMSFEIWKEKILHVVMEKKEFVSLDESKLVAHYRIFGLSEIWIDEHNQRFAS